MSHKSQLMRNLSKSFGNPQAILTLLLELRLVLTKLITTKPQRNSFPEIAEDEFPDIREKTAQLKIQKKNGIR